MAKHLIDPHTTDQGPVDAADYLDQLRAAHDAIIAQAVGWTPAQANRSWGIHTKRRLVDVSGVHTSGGDVAHPIAELMNISATVERLMDALEWAIRNDWATWVIECHPSTSSSPSRPDLRTKGAQGEACFEVSDVAGRSDGNRKLQNDLGRLAKVPGEAATFLVGSPQWGERIKHRKLEYETWGPDYTIIVRVRHTTQAPAATPDVPGDHTSIPAPT